MPPHTPIFGELAVGSMNILSTVQSLSRHAAYPWEVGHRHLLGGHERRAIPVGFGWCSHEVLATVPHHHGRPVIGHHAQYRVEQALCLSKIALFHSSQSLLVDGDRLFEGTGQLALRADQLEHTVTGAARIELYFVQFSQLE